MARYSGPVCRLCRREGLKLDLKGDRCLTDKCAFERRAYAPGQHRQMRIKKSDYAVQLREKQKAKRIYAIAEKQFRNYFKKAEKSKGITGEVLIQLLERRLDNIVYRMGFAASRCQARMLVRHGHFCVNGRKVNIPSYLLKANDVVTIKEKSKANAPIVAAAKALEKKQIPAWLDIDRANLKGTLMTIPSRDDIVVPIEEHLIVELYSK